MLLGGEHSSKICTVQTWHFFDAEKFTCAKCFENRYKYYWTVRMTINDVLFLMLLSLSITNKGFRHHRDGETDQSYAGYHFCPGTK